MKKFIRKSLFGLAALVSATGTTGECGYNLGPIYIPDSQEAIDAGVHEPQPLSPEDAFQEEQEIIFPLQRGFVSSLLPDLISANSLPDILRVADPDSQLGECFTYIQFPSFEKYTNKSILEAKLILTQTLTSGDQSDSTLNIDIGLIDDAWDQSAFNFHNIYQTIIGTNEIPLNNSTPGRVYEIDLLQISVGTLPSGADQNPIDFWTRNPDRNFGLSIKSSFYNPSSRQFRTFYGSGQEQVRIRLRSNNYSGA